MAFLVGGGSCALALFVDLTLSRRYHMPWYSVPWWLLRLILEAGEGMFAILVLKGGTALAARDVYGPGAWVLVGLLAPKLLRRIHYGDPAGPGVSFDIQDLVDRVAGPLNVRIDGASAQSEAASSAKLAHRLEKAGITAADVAERVIAVVRHRHRLETKTAEVRYLRQTVTSMEPEDLKLRLIIDKARELGALRTVKHAAGRRRKSPLSRRPRASSVAGRSGDRRPDRLR
jgi:hypothetical protein